MSQRTDWFPTTREGIPAMADDWIAVCTTRQTDWNIPGPALTELTTLRGSAGTALETATTHTPVATAQCKEAFDALTGFMRDFKRRYFLSPPLLDSDFISLGLKPHDPIPTLSGPPTAQVGQKACGFLRSKTPKLSGISRIARHELGVRLIYVAGSPADPANKGCRIHYTVTAQGETPPANPDDLHKSFFTKRKKDVIEFEFGDSGKTACFAVQIENDGKKGLWGPLVGVIIP